MKLYRSGSSGAAVRDIQARLGVLGFDIGIDAEGEFGSSTEKAVKAFQTKRGLDADGIVGPDTWRDLANSGHRIGDRLLYHRRPMIRGDDVFELQKRLNSLGFDSGKEDGIFGPDTLRALLDFQRNRNMAEDGICGSEVATELDLVKRATTKEGRRDVAERLWITELPMTVAGLRIMLDPAVRTEEEGSAAWRAVTAAAAVLRDKGATVLISRSEDTEPEASLRASRINRQGVDLVISFGTAAADGDGCYFFATERSSSEAGHRIATEIGKALETPIAGRSYVLLRETRAPAVVINDSELGEGTGVAAAAGLLALLARPPEKRQ
ncbi:MAG: peptidoglycan-binding protein [Acidimicrobiia bacterium]|nr:peptidoglycan-binding protein [Acidimicrobiia bacterium]